MTIVDDICRRVDEGVFDWQILATSFKYIRIWADGPLQYSDPLDRAMYARMMALMGDVW